MPYFVISDPTSPKRIVWLGSSETWRLRQAENGTAYHERFWTKLLRYAGRGRRTKLNKRITLELGGPYKTDQFIEVDARILGKSGEALGEAEKPRIILKAPPGVEPRLAAERGQPGDEAEVDRRRHVHRLLPPAVAGRLQGGGDGAVDARHRGRHPPRGGGQPRDGRHPARLHGAVPDGQRGGRAVPEQHSRVGSADELLKRLVRPRGEGKETEKKQGKETPRLFFDLGNADLIPSLLDKKVTENTISGKTEDIWDRGWFAVKDEKSGRERAKVPYVLAAAVGLWSLEWLIRKLLRLA